MKTSQQKGVLNIRKLLILVASTLIIQVSNAQDSPGFKHATYKVIVGTNSDRRISVGYLSSISDTSVYISSLPVKFNGYANSNSNLPGISYNQIFDVRLRRKGSTTPGLLIGAIAGAAVGAIIGFAGGNDFEKNRNGWCLFCLTAGQKAEAGGFILGSIGSGIGALIGRGAHKTFAINNNKEKFDELKWSLTH
jgi:hypothetical protein